MADISKITLPSGSTYDIKDAVARAAITGGMLAFIGVPSKLYNGDTEVAASSFADGNTTVNKVKLSAAVNIRGTSYAAGDIYTVQNGDTMIVSEKEYVATVASSSVTWHEFGSTADLGAWAYWNAGHVTFNPTGSVGIFPDIAGPEDANIAAIVTTGADIDGNYTPSGTVSQPTFTGSSTTSTGSYTPAGGVSLTNSNKTATVAAAESGDATYTPAGTVSQPTFSGTGVRLVTGDIAVPKTYSFTGSPGSVSVSGTPSGTVSQPTFTGSATTSTGTFTATGTVTTATTENKTATVAPAASGTATYTPAGSITQPTISVATAGATGTIHNPTKKTVVTDMDVAEPSSTTATGELVYFSVSNETLTLKKFVETTGDSITTSDVTVKTGDASYSASGAAFSGTGVRLVTGNIAVPATYTFTGTEDQAVSVSGTPSGTVSQPTFTGKALTSTGSFTPSGSVATATTENKSATVSATTGAATYTPAGTVSQPSFTGTGARLVTGNIAVPTSASFSGTEATISVTGTPSGTVSQPTFSGTKVLISASTDVQDIAAKLGATFSSPQLTVQVAQGAS